MKLRLKYSLLIFTTIIIFTGGCNFQKVEKIITAKGTVQINDIFLRDNKNVYWKACPPNTEGACNQALIPLKNADPDSFVVLDEWYAKDSKQVYCNIGHMVNCVCNKIGIIFGADAYTFEILGQGYAKDKQYVYFIDNILENQKIKQADVNTFEVLANKYAKDKNHMYYNGEIAKDYKYKN